MIEQGLFQLVAQNAAVKSLVGVDTSGTTKAFWILAQKGASVPYLVFQRTATSDLYSMNGFAGVRDALFQVDCYATSYYASRSIAAAVREVLQSYKGTLPDSTQVLAVLTEKDWDLEYEEGSKGFVFRAMLEFRIWYIDNA
ncbi:MAG TPA: DUF3168 domain-containing protein [Terriglobales bacterium]|jgi:hypothetical protein|nr:DUF3168 domain-containing protein [Terriglobales bacterium]